MRLLLITKDSHHICIIRGVSSRGVYALDELNQGEGHIASLNMPLMKLEIVCFCL